MRIANAWRLIWGLVENESMAIDSSLVSYIATTRLLCRLLSKECKCLYAVSIGYLVFYKRT
jgi:hypothetical protein